ncbi:hypothetical protein Taro_041918 [Colocasia esculenta]|uniref:Uncharacterized protein n=1 Tax=Colocasia esculenta TaxID=4460 RepID=A0A843WN27_COLES|nr:hypothetical protein [Colocasia esculenta]
MEEQISKTKAQTPTPYEILHSSSQKNRRKHEKPYSSPPSSQSKEMEPWEEDRGVPFIGSLAQFCTRIAIRSSTSSHLDCQLCFTPQYPHRTGSICMHSTASAGSVQLAASIAVRGIHQIRFQLSTASAGSSSRLGSFPPSLHTHRHGKQDHL